MKEAKPGPRQQQQVIKPQQRMAEARLPNRPPALEVVRRQVRPIRLSPRPAQAARPSCRQREDRKKVCGRWVYDRVAPAWDGKAETGARRF